MPGFGFRTHMNGLLSRSQKIGVDRSGIGGYNCSETKTGGQKLANETGKRYFCSKCGAEFIVTTGGEGAMMCCGEPAQKK